jgi:hypothetical protein
MGDPGREELSHFATRFPPGDIERAWRECGGDFRKALAWLDGLGISAYQAEFGFSRSVCRDMYAATAGDREKARLSLPVWENLVLEARRGEKRWESLSPQARAKSFIAKLPKSRTFRDLCDTGLLSESGPLWLIDPEGFAALPSGDKVLEWLYTACLIAETDHVPDPSGWAEAMRWEFQETLSAHGWADVIVALSRQDVPDGLSERLFRWIGEHAGELAFFTVWKGDRP